MKRKHLLAAAGFLMGFVVWTILVCHIDVRRIGPNESLVGLAGINQFVHGLTGVNFSLYNLTDWLGLVPIAVCFCFCTLGIYQWVTRNSIRKVDFSILLLGGFYIVTAAVFLLYRKYPAYWFY